MTVTVLNIRLTDLTLSPTISPGKGMTTRLALCPYRYPCVQDMVIHLKNEVLTVTQTCRYLKVSPRTIYRYIQGRHLPAFKLGKEWRFVRTDLAQWLQERSILRS